jgi:hypothetical protein
VVAAAAPGLGTATPGLRTAAEDDLPFDEQPAMSHAVAQDALVAARSRRRLKLRVVVVGL